MSLVKQLRNALEFARFTSPDIRDAFVECIKQLDGDLDYVNFDPDVGTLSVFRALGAAISEFENSDADTTVPAVVEGETDEVDSEIPLVFDAKEEIERVLKPEVVVSDDDDIDI